jgi:hypothetical protein
MATGDVNSVFAPVTVEISAPSGEYTVTLPN